MVENTKKPNFVHSQLFATETPRFSKKKIKIQFAMHMCAIIILKAFCYALLKDLDSLKLCKSHSLEVAATAEIPMILDIFLLILLLLQHCFYYLYSYCCCFGLYSDLLGQQTNQLQYQPIREAAMMMSVGQVRHVRHATF